MQATHWLLRQTEVAPEHVVCVTQVPVASQLWIELPRHRVVLGTQTPWQEPLTHAMFEHALPAVHVPLALHVCGVFPEQLV